MKYTLWRSHKVRPAEYESLDFGGRVEADTEVDEDFADVGYVKAGKMLSDALDDLLDKEINSALSLGQIRPEMDNTHLWDVYTEPSN